MKNLLYALALVLAFSAANAHAAYYLELGGVEGESRASSGALQVEATVVATSTPARASTKTSTSLDVMAETGDEKKGKVEMEWKVEEGTKAATQGVEPDEIDVSMTQENATNFGVLLGGSDTSDERKQGLERAAAVILEHAQASGQAMESISLNFTKIEYKMKTDAKLFGFIPTTMLATVEIDETEAATVKLPWWSFLVTGVEREEIGLAAKETLSNILKAKHDTIKNAISNVR